MFSSFDWLTGVAFIFMLCRPVFCGTEGQVRMMKSSFGSVSNSVSFSSICSEMEYVPVNSSISLLLERMISSGVFSEIYLLFSIVR